MGGEALLHRLGLCEALTQLRDHALRMLVGHRQHDDLGVGHRLAVVGGDDLRGARGREGLGLFQLVSELTDLRSLPRELARAQHQRNACPNEGA